MVRNYCRASSGQKGSQSTEGYGPCADAVISGLRIATGLSAIRGATKWLLRVNFPPDWVSMRRPWLRDQNRRPLAQRRGSLSRHATNRGSVCHFRRTSMLRSPQAADVCHWLLRLCRRRRAFTLIKPHKALAAPVPEQRAVRSCLTAARAELVPAARTRCRQRPPDRYYGFHRCH